MGRRRTDRGARRGAGRRAVSSRDQGRSDAQHNRAVAGAGVSAPSRLLLTRLLHEGVLWDVHITTTPRPGASNITQLEFEGTGEKRGKVRYTRPVEGALLEALHSGIPVSRAGLEEELELAIRQAGAVGGVAVTIGTEPSDPGGDDN